MNWEVKSILANPDPYFGEGDVGGDGEERLVVDLRLDPVHEEGDVLGCWKVDWLLVLHSVLHTELRIGRNGMFCICLNISGRPARDIQTWPLLTWWDSSPLCTVHRQCHRWDWSYWRNRHTFLCYLKPFPKLFDVITVFPSGFAEMSIRMSFEM